MALRPGRALCFALALWNGRTHPERALFVSRTGGNHGEDVKDSTLPRLHHPLVHEALYK